MRSSLRGVKHGDATSRQTSRPSSEQKLGNQHCIRRIQHTGFVLIKTASGLRFRDNYSQPQSTQFVEEPQKIGSNEHAGKY